MYSSRDGGGWVSSKVCANRRMPDSGQLGQIIVCQPLYSVRESFLKNGLVMNFLVKREVNDTINYRRASLGDGKP